MPAARRQGLHGSAPCALLDRASVLMHARRHHRIASDGAVRPWPAFLLARRDALVCRPRIRCLALLLAPPSVSVNERDTLLSWCLYSFNFTTSLPFGDSLCHVDYSYHREVTAFHRKPSGSLPLV